MFDVGEPILANESSGLLASLALLPDELQRLLQGRSAEVLRRPASDGGWGIIEHLCYLLDWNSVYTGWILAVQLEEEPELEPMDDELWVIEHHYRDQDPIRVRDDLRRERLALVDDLRQISPGTWLRAGRVGRDRLTIRDMVERLRDMDQRHLREIADALA